MPVLGHGCKKDYKRGACVILRKLRDDQRAGIEVRALRRLVLVLTAFFKQLSKSSSPRAYSCQQYCAKNASTLLTSDVPMKLFPV